MKRPGNTGTERLRGQQDMTDFAQWHILRRVIQKGDVPALETFRLENPELDLSQFPGEAGWTPLAHAVLYGQQEVFRYLLDIVNVQAPITVPTLLHNTSAGTIENRNILSFCVMAQPDGVNYFEYARMLCHADVEICSPGIHLSSQPVWVLLERMFVLRRRIDVNTPGLTVQDNTEAINNEYAEVTNLLNEMVTLEVRKTRRSGASILMHIFCKQVPMEAQRSNVLGRILLQLSENGEDIKTDLYDLSRLFFDNTTRKIYEIIIRQHSEKMLVLRLMATPQDRSGKSKFAIFFDELPDDLREYIIEEATPSNLLSLQFGGCPICFEERNLHMVCEIQHHAMCGCCYAEMVERLNFNCPICYRVFRFLDNK